jgi:tetratricopeptide (TPR) repeat protein
MTPEASSEIGVLLDSVPRCIVFDGIESIAPQKREFLEDWFSQLVRFTKTTAVVFTSQTPLHSVDVQADFELRPLSKEDSLELIRVNGRRAKLGQEDLKQSLRIDKATVGLVRFCDGHALTLKIVSGLLRFFSGPSEVLERIQCVGTAALENPTRKTQTKSTSLTVALTVAYSSLCAQERRLVYMLSQCPAGCFAEGAGLFELDDAEMAIANLRRWHLLQSESYGALERIRLLSPIRTFVENSYERESPSEANDALIIVVKTFAIQALILCHQHIQAGDIVYGVTRFGHEFANFLHLFDKAYSKSEKDQAFLRWVGALATSMQVFCFIRGFWDRGAEIMRIGADASIRTGMPSSASQLLLQSIVLCQKTGSYQVDKIEQTVDQIEEIAEKYREPRLFGYAALAKGDLLLVQHKYDHAYDQFTLAAEQFRIAKSQNCNGKDAPQSAGELAESGSSLGEDEHMLALSLMQLGFAREHTAKPTEALVAYRQAAELMERDRDVLNLGSVLHQMGNCHCQLKDYEFALDEYAKAANIFFAIGVRGHLSNSVSEMGHLFIEHDTGADISLLLTPECLEASIDDLLADVSTCYSSVSSGRLHEEACVPALRKAFGIIALFSCIPNRVLLQSLAMRLRQEVVIPLRENRTSSIRMMRSFSDVLIMYLDVIVAICGSIRAAEPKRRRSPKTLLMEIEHLARLCYELSDFAWNAFRVFDWLAMYIARIYKIKDITAGALLVAVESAVLSNASFTLNLSPME